MEKKAQLFREVAQLEPLTAPFEQITPLVKGNFSNTRDLLIVHWFIDRYSHAMRNESQFLIDLYPEEWTTRAIWCNLFRGMAPDGLPHGKEPWYD